MAQYSSLLIRTDQLDASELQEFIPFNRTEGNPDFISVGLLEDKLSISIDQVHELQHELAFKPFSESYKIALIFPAHRLSLPAQQALLKTLEEPPENTQIILATSLPNKLLPTILSRVTHVGRTNAASNDVALYGELTSLKLSACLKASDEWSKDREKTIGKLRDLVFELQSFHLTSPTPSVLTHEKAVILCLEQLERNVNAKLALDQLFFRLSGHIKMPPTSEG